MERVADYVYLIDSFRNYEPGIISTYLVDIGDRALIEPGVMSGAEIVLDELKSAGIESVKYIAPTHVHIDHAGSAAKLAKALNSLILAHPKGVKHIVNPERLWEASKVVLGPLAEVYGKPEPIDESRVIAVEDNQEFDLGDEKLIVYHAPGHAPHMIAFQLRKLRMLFPADAVGMYVNGKTFPLTPPPFDYEKAIATMERFIELKPDYVAFTHFGVAEGYECIVEAKERLERWFEIAKDVAAKGGGVEELAAAIEREDEDARRLKESFSGGQFYSFLLTALFGLIDAARKS